MDIEPSILPGLAQALPADVLFLVFSQIKDPHDRFRLQSVCKHWHLCCRQVVTHVRLCALTPSNFATIYPAVTSVSVCDPSMRTDSRQCLVVPLIQKLCMLTNLRCGPQSFGV